MIIELVGLPGSGKTTFAKRLAEGGVWKLVSVHGAPELIFYNALFLLRYPRSFFATLFWLYRHRGLREFWYTKFVNLFLVHNAKYMKVERCPRAIIDQGHQQNVISLFDASVSAEIIDRYVRVLPKPDVLCFFLANEETRTKRLAERGYGTRGELSEDYREAWEEAREAHFEHLYATRNILSCVTEVVTLADEAQKREKIAHARVWHFVLHGRMPTEKAHGLQIAKTMEALVQKGVYATLWVPRRENALTRDVSAYYDLRATLPVRTFFAPNFLRLPRFFGQLRFWLDALGFFLALAFTRVDREGVYYTRNPELAWLLKTKGAAAWYEAHLLPSSKVWLLKFFLAHVDGIIANSEGTARALNDRGFLGVHVVRNGVDIERFTNALARDGARTLLGLPQDKKQWRMLVRFMNGKITLVLVGGTEKDLERVGTAKAYHELPNVLLVPHSPSEKVPAYLSAADVLVLPNMPTSEESIRYTSPIKLFEYMASGRPIVAADLPSIREVLSEETAILFVAGNGDALARGIGRALAAPDEVKQLSERARKEVHMYSWEAHAQLLLNIVRSAPRDKKSAHRQFLQSLIVGGFAAVFYLILVYVLTEEVGLWYVVSVFVAYLIVFFVNFSLLKAIFVGGVRKTPHELSRYALLVLINFLLNELAMHVLVEYLNLWYMLAQVLIMGTLMIMNFFAYRSSIFQTSRSGDN
jgi:glycosyltransferase involved in cell wall biosynthesis/cytidylate kinase